MTLFGMPVIFTDEFEGAQPPVFGDLTFKGDFPLLDFTHGDCLVCGRPGVQIMTIYRGRERIGEACGLCAGKIVHSMSGM